MEALERRLPRSGSAPAKPLDFELTYRGSSQFSQDLRLLPGKRPAARHSTANHREKPANCHSGNGTFSRLFMSHRCARIVRHYGEGPTSGPMSVQVIEDGGNCQDIIVLKNSVREKDRVCRSDLKAVDLHIDLGAELERFRTSRHVLRSRGIKGVGKRVSLSVQDWRHGVE